DPLRGSAGRHRLRAAGGEVEDGQSAVPQPHAERSVVVPVRGVRYDGVMELTLAHPTEQEALAVRSTVRLEVVHALQDRRVDRAAQTDRAYDPAHGACSSCLGVRIRRYPRGWVARLSPGERSEEHTSELQSRGHLVCRLLLEKK